MPPAMARYARDPARGLPKLNRLPRRNSMLSQSGVSLPSIVGERSAPVMATIASRSNWSSGPFRVSSRTAAPSEFPTRRLATVAAKQSHRSRNGDAVLLMAVASQVLDCGQPAALHDSDADRFHHLSLARAIYTPADSISRRVRRQNSTAAGGSAWGGAGFGMRAGVRRPRAHRLRGRRSLWYRNSVGISLSTFRIELDAARGTEAHTVQTPHDRREVSDRARTVATELLSRLSSFPRHPDASRSIPPRSAVRWHGGAAGSAIHC